MPFEKGKSGNPNGRKVGTVNKKTEQWKKFAEWFMESGIEKLQEEMDKLEGKEFVREFKDLMEYFQPKLSRTELTGSKDNPVSITIKKTYKDENNN